MAPGAGLVEEFALITFQSAGGEYHGSKVLMQGTILFLQAVSNQQPAVNLQAGD